MELESWLREECKSTIDFAREVGCTKMTLSRVKRGIPVSKKVSIIIYHLTNGKVRPQIAERRS